jgi:hypothetical protein
MWLIVGEKQAMAGMRTEQQAHSRPGEAKSEGPRMSHVAYRKAEVIEKEDLAGPTAQSGGSGFKGHCSIRISLSFSPTSSEQAGDHE